MPDGNRKLDEAAAVEVFGLNVDCCLKLLGSDLESLAVRADIDKKILIGYKLGQGRLTDSRIESISAELGIDPEILTKDHGDSEAREDAIKIALINAGKIEDDEDSDVPEIEEPPGENIHELAPVWKDDLTVSLGSTVFNLVTKEDRALVMGHIRAARGTLSQGKVLEMAGLKKNTTWWARTEQGTTRIYRNDLEQIAKVIGVSVGILLTGYGLDESKMKPTKRGPSTRTIELPFLSQEDRNEYFRARVLSSKTEPAEGVAIGELLELARNQESVDWEDAWLRLTKQGATVLRLIDKWDSELRKAGEPIQVMIIERLLGRFSNQVK